MQERDLLIEFPQKGGNQIKVTDKETGIVILFKNKQPIDVPSIMNNDINEIARQMMEILEQWESFDAESIINPVDYK